MEYKYLRYQGKVVQTHLKSWGPYLLAYVGVTNANNRVYVLNSKRDDISIQLRPLQYYMLPLETEQLVKLLQRGSKHNKEVAKNIQQNSWTLGPVTINGNSQWDQLFYFHPDTEQLFFSVHAYERSLTPFDVQVYLDGVAFVFPFKVGE